MSSATKVIATGVIVTIAALGATGVIGRLDRTGQTASDSPEASSATPMVGEDWAFFSGTLTFNGEPFAGTNEPYEDNGLFVILGYGYTGQTMTASDTRMTGIRTERLNSFADALDDNRVNVDAVLVTIENDDGGWTCPLFQVAIRDVGASQSGWCEGTGGYDGFRAYVVFDTGGGAAGASIPVYGFITSRDGPPMPEAPAS